MSFFSLSLPMGRFAGISVRIHFTFFITAAYFLQQQFRENYLFGIAAISGFYFCILLHEFGHALAARWCDGEAKQIILWPLGGLALCRPIFNPVAHLITSAAGPFVTLILFICFYILHRIDFENFYLGSDINRFIDHMMGANLILLLFNLIPAFPMDGGRILRDSLWIWLGPERATQGAVILTKIIAVVAMGWSLLNHNYYLVVLALFIFTQASLERMMLKYEGKVRPFSIRERFLRGNRKRTEEPVQRSFHRCVVCGRTEMDSTDLRFRICSDGQEYCTDHLPNRFI
jgi:Zn-dependent protease